VISNIKIQNKIYKKVLNKLNKNIEKILEKKTINKGNIE